MKILLTGANGAVGQAVQTTAFTYDQRMQDDRLHPPALDVRLPALPSA